MLFHKNVHLPRTSHEGFWCTLPHPHKKNPSVLFSLLCFPIDFQIKFKVFFSCESNGNFGRNSCVLIASKKNVYFVVHDFAGKLNVARANEILQECLRWLRGSW